MMGLIPGVRLGRLPQLCMCCAHPPGLLSHPFQYMGYFAIFSLLRLALLQREVEGYHPLGGGVTALAANPGAAGRAREHPVAASSVPTPLWRTAPAPLVVSPSNSPPPLQPCKVQMELTPGVVVSSPRHITGGETEAQ